MHMQKKLHSNEAQMERVYESFYEWKKITHTHTYTHRTFQAFTKNAEHLLVYEGPAFRKKVLFWV